MAFKVFTEGTHGDMERLKQESKKEEFKRGLLDISKYFTRVNSAENKHENKMKD